MKKSIIIYLAFFISSLTYGQYSGQAASNMSVGGSMDGSAAIIASLVGDIDSRATKRNKTYEDFQGSPYVSNVFLPTIMYYKEENMGSIFYRYNALNEEVEIKDSGLESEAPKSLLRDKEVSILVDGKKMSFNTFVTSKNKTINGYLTRLNSDKDYRLYKRIHVKFTEGKPAANSFVKAVPSRFSQYTEYYFQKDGVNRIDEIPLKNNSLLKLLDDDKRNQVKTYLKENNLNIKEEADLVRVFQFLNN